MRWPRRYSRRSDEDAFTFAEVLVGLLIVSVLGTAVATGISGALRAVDRIEARLLESSRLLRLDDSLRDLAARVRTPYWAPAHEVTSTQDGFAIAGLDGESATVLSVEFRQGTLFVGDGRTVQQYTGFADVRLAVVEDPDRGMYAIRLHVVPADSREIAIIARLGSAPLGRSTE